MNFFFFGGGGGGGVLANHFLLVLLLRWLGGQQNTNQFYHNFLDMIGKVIHNYLVKKNFINFRFQI